MIDTACKYILIFTLIVIGLALIKKQKQDVKVEITHKFDNDWGNPLYIKQDK
jgi:hypothetical protein